MNVNINIEENIFLMNKLFIIRIDENIFSDILKSSEMNDMCCSHNLHYVTKINKSYKNE
jgi:hypothetical protein